MISQVFPLYDSVLYEESSSLNSGRDEILELTKTKTSGSSANNSRILIKFDLAAVSQSIVDGDISSTHKFYLNLSATEAKEIPAEYTINVFPVSQSWDNGVGKLFNNPITKDGVSWTYRDGEDAGTVWTTSSFAPATTGSFATTAGGGTWYTGSGFEASQSYSFESSDMRMDVTGIVDKWLSGSITNDGFIIKRTDADEQSNDQQGSLKFFSRETHTIYVPRLEVAWDDSVFSTGSLSPLTDENIVFYVKNLSGEYKDNAKAKIRVFGRARYPTKAFSTSSAFLETKYLPTSSFYSIVDAHTEEIIVPFDDNYTKLSLDSSGNYVNLWMSDFQLQRYYKLIFKVVRSADTLISDGGHYFRVKK